MKNVRRGEPLAIFDDFRTNEVIKAYTRKDILYIKSRLDEWEKEMTLQEKSK